MSKDPGKNARSHKLATGGGGVTDHGALTGLGDDDHTQYLLADGTRTLSGDLAVTGTVDGRDVSVDGTKLDGIEAGATADQAWGDITGTLSAQTDLQSALDLALPKTGGAMTGAITTSSTFDGRDVATDGTKLDGIESGATADQAWGDITGTLSAQTDLQSAIDAASLAKTDQTLTSARTVDNSTGAWSFYINMTDGAKRATQIWNPALGLMSAAADDGTNGIARIEDPNGLNIIFSGTADLKLDSSAGTSGERLTTNGANSSPTWERASVIPSGTAPTSPADGQVWLDTGTHGLYYWNSAGSRWIDTSREKLLWGKPGASGTGSGYFLLSANLNLGTYGVEIQEDIILDSVEFSSDGTTSGSWTFRVKKNGTQIYGLAAPTSGSYDEVYSGDLISAGHTFAAGDRMSTEFGSGAGSASFTDASLIVRFRRTG